MNILLVEDESTTAGQLEKSLRTSGHLVTVARSGADARWVGGRFDVGLFDLQLFDDSSLELARELLASGGIRSALVFSRQVDPALFEVAARLANSGD